MLCNAREIKFLTPIVTSMYEQKTKKVIMNPFYGFA